MNVELKRISQYNFSSFHCEKPLEKTFGVLNEKYFSQPTTHNPHTERSRSANPTTSSEVVQS